ncbi:transporter [Spirochaetia bacterium]|nr:transporter [Spirochaetia bacterium]
MNKRALRADILLLLTACIWGFGFVAQRSGMQYVGPFAYNGIRFILGSLSLLPLIFYRKKQHPGKSSPKKIILYSLAAGSCLFTAVSLQQLGLIFTTAGNAGFITGLYVVLVPAAGIFLGRKTGIPTWLGAVFALAGLYFLSAAGHIGKINPGDIITAVSALFWTAHVLTIDRLVQKIDPIVLSSGQFACCGLFAMAAAFTLEPQVASWADTLIPQSVAGGLLDWQSLPEIIAAGKNSVLMTIPAADILIPILYGGLGSVGIAYTLQTIGQQDAPPAHATIIMSLEGCFAAAGGALLLHERLSSWTILGFILMLGGMLITQWDVIAKPHETIHQ